MSSAPLTFGVFANQLKRCKRKLGPPSKNIKQSIDIWENFPKCLKSMTSIHLNSELYSVSPATGSVHANILFEVPTVHIWCFCNITIIIIMTLVPLSIKSFGRPKKVRNKLRASELLARAWCLCVSDSCQGVIFWSCHLPSIWKVWITKNTLYLSSEASLFSDVEGRGVEEMVTLPSPLPKVLLQTFLFSKLKNIPYAKGASNPPTKS